MTGRQLLEILLQLSEKELEMTVETEGCDCCGYDCGVDISRGNIEITREVVQPPVLIRKIYDVH